MNYVKRVVTYLLVGVGFGSLVYLFFLWQNGAATQTVHQITNVVLMSGLIGLVSMIFEVESIPIAWKFFIHFIVVYGLKVWFIDRPNNNTGSFILSWNYLGTFIIVYLVIWFVVRITLNNRVKNINRKLREKHKKMVL